MKNTEQSAFNVALYSIERSAKSEREMREYLKRREFDDDIIERTMAKLADYGYIDDLRLAREIVRSTLLFKGLGRNRARQKLYEKRVSQDAAARALAEIDESDEANGETELQSAVKWAKKISAALDGDDPRSRGKLYSRLMAKGFSGSVAARAISIAKESDEEDDDAF